MRNRTLLIAILVAAGLTSSPGQDTWIRKADFGGTERNGAVGFSIGSKGYLGTGLDRPLGNRKDFWEYDPATNAWTQKADFGGTERAFATGFSIGSKGYLGTGVDDPLGNRKDFWEYDPVPNIWTQKADFGGTERALATGFSIGSKGYIGTGSNYFGGTYFKDFWEYDPATNAWTQKADFGGAERPGAVGFSIGSKGYIGTGVIDNFTEPVKDFWEYDPFTNTWTQKADLGGSERLFGVGFSIGQKGYIGTGYNFFNFFKDFWEYDPATNAWTQKADFGGSGTVRQTGFSIGQNGYVGTGNPGNGELLKEFWEYTPGETSLALRSAASRRKQGRQTFDLNLPIRGTSGVEPRHPGPGGSAFVVFIFSNNVTAVDGTTSTCGTVVSTTIDSGNAHNVIVQGVGACDQQDVIVTLNGVHDDQGNTLTSAAVTVGNLYGDVNGDRRITRDDLEQIRAHQGQAVDASNFMNDINVSGFIDIGDVRGARHQRGHRLR